MSGNGLIIRTVGSFGETEIEFEKESNVFDSFDFFGNNQSFTVSFNFCLFKQCLKALLNSKKTCIRINYDGILSLQFMILLSDESKSSFIEFAVLNMHHLINRLLRQCQIEIFYASMDFWAASIKN